MNIILFFGVAFIAGTSAYYDKQFCRPLEDFKLDCNLCFCNMDGLTYQCSTNYECASGKPHLRFKGDDGQWSISETKECLPGSQKRHFCNNCICSQDGNSYSCTNDDCDDITWLDKNGSLKPGHCRPLDTFVEMADRTNSKCRLCRCGEDSRQKYCTDVQCDAKALREYDSRNKY